MRFIFVLFIFLLNPLTGVFSQCKATITQNRSICLGDTLNLKSNANGKWFSSDNNLITNIKSNEKYNIAPKSTTTYKFLEDGCKDSLKVTITVNPLPIAPSFEYTKEKCFNELIEFTNTTSGTELKYKWNFNGNNTSSLINPTYIFPEVFGNNYSSLNVVLEAINSYGCVSSTSQTISIKQVPDPSITDNTSNKPFLNCGGSEFELKIDNTSTTKTTNTNYEFIWGDDTPNNSFNNSTFSNTITHIYIKKGYSDLILNVTGSNGCKNQKKHIVFNGTNPAVGIPAPGSSVEFCAPKTLSFKILETKDNPPGTIYTIETNTGQPKVVYNHPPPSEYIHVFDSSSCGATGAKRPNTFYVYILAENPCGYSDNIASPITISIKPKADFTEIPQKKSCINTNVFFYNTSKAGKTVDNFGNCSTTTKNNWLITPSSGWTVTSGSLGDPNPTNNKNTWGSNTLGINFTKAGTYYISMIVSNTCGSDTITKPYCVQTPPVPTFTVTNKTGCAPFITNFTNTSTNINQCDSIERKWIITKLKSNCDKDSILDYRFISGTTENSNNPIIRFNNQGEYNVSIQLKNMCGIPNSPVEKIVVERKPKLVIVAPDNICFGESILPTATTQDCGNPITSYNWTFTEGTPSSNNSLIAPKIQYSTSGLKKITLEATNSCGTTKETKSIEVLNPPVIDAGLDQQICSGDSIRIGTNGLNGLTYNWNPTMGLSNSKISNPKIALLNLSNSPIKYKYLLTALNVANCKNEDSVFITVNPLPNLTITPTSEICENQTKNLTISGADDYKWEPTTYLNATTGSNVSASPSKTITYTVTGTNKITTCKDTISTKIIVNKLPTVNAGEDQTICNQPIPVTLNPINSNGTWSGKNITSNGTYTPNGIGTTEAIFTLTDDKGCKNTDTILVITKNPESAEAGSNVTECLNSIDKLLVGIPTGGIWSGSSIVTSNGVLSFNQIGKHKLYYNIGNGSCSTKDSIEVFIKSLPEITLNKDTSICINSNEINIKSSPSGGFWTGQGILNNIGVFNPKQSGKGTFKVFYEYKDSVTSCSNIKEVNIEVNDTTEINIGKDTILCNQPNPVLLKGTPTGGIWSGNNISNNGLFTPNSIGDFKINYEYTNVFNCKSKAQKMISVIIPIQASAGKDDSICYNQESKQLIGSPLNGTWTGESISKNGFTVKSAPGIYFNIYSYGTGNCLTTDTMKLIILSPPKVFAGNDKSFCNNDYPYDFIGIPNGGKWRGPGIIDEKKGTFDPTIITLGKYDLIYSYYDNKSGCSNEDTIEVNINPVPIIDFEIDSIQCKNVEKKINNNSKFPGNSNWNFGNQKISTERNPTISYTQIGTYNIKLIETSPFGCIDSLTKRIDVLEAPIANFSIDKDSMCSPAEVTINDNSLGSNIKYLWNYGNGKFDSIKNPGPVFYQQGIIGDTVYQLSLSVSNLCGISKMSKNIKVMPIPVAMFYTNISSGCSPLTVDIYNNTLGLPINYKWNFGNESSTRKDSLFKKVFTTDSVIKIYEIRLIAENKCGVDTIIKSITVKPNTINAFFNVDKNEGCNDLTIKFTENSIGQTFSSWDFGDGNKTTDKNPSHTFKKAGEYTAKLNITNGCSYDTASIKIKVLPSPIVNFTIDKDSMCQFGIFKFNSFTSDDVSLEWDFGDGTKSQNVNYEHLYLSSGPFSVKLKATNLKNGCISEKYEDVFVHRKPVASFEIDTTNGCVPLTVTFNNNSIDAKYYAWDFNDGNTSNQRELNHTFIKSGDLSVRLIVENGYGCKDTITKNINPYPIPIIDFNYTMTDPCYSPLLVKMINNSTGANNYQWDFGNGLSSTSTNPDTKYFDAGVHPITLTGSNTYNCSSALTKKITVNQKPTADFELKIKNGCVPLEIEIVNNSINSNFYNWNFGDKNASNTKDPKHIYNKDGKFEITLITENDEGCKDTISKSVLVYPLPIADFTLKNSDPCIQPMFVSTNNTSTGAVSYTWDFEDGINSTLIHPEINYNTVGIHKILLTAKNEYGCENQKEKKIENYNTPRLYPNVLPSGYCEKDELVYSINSDFINKITWDMGNNTIMTGSSFSYAYPKYGNYTLKVIGQGDGICADTLEITQKIIVNPDPIANFNYEALKNDELLNGTIQFINQSKQAESYTWLFGEGNSSELVNPIHKFENYGDFKTTLIAYNKYKCVDSITVNVNVELFKGLHVPNAIYLGHKDFNVSHFKPKGVGLLKYEITIYDDWGNLIWSSTAIDEYGRPIEAWDGKYKDEYVQQDSYVWKVNAIFIDNSLWQGKEYENSVYKNYGTVTVIK